MDTHLKYSKDMEGLLTHLSEIRSGEILAVLDSLSPCKPWLVGGAVRSAVDGSLNPNDIDIVVENGSYGLALEIASSKYGELTSNRHGNARFKDVHGYGLDIWSPERFFRGYEDLPGVLMNVDFTCNSLALSPQGHFMSHHQCVSDIQSRQLRPIKPTWESRSAQEYAHLLGRAANMVLNQDYKPVVTDFLGIAEVQIDEKILKSKYGFYLTDALKMLKQ